MRTATFVSLSILLVVVLSSSSSVLRLNNNPQNHSDQELFNLTSCSQDNGGCQHVCLSTVHGPQCRCKDGYVSSHDGKVCSEVYSRDHVKKPKKTLRSGQVSSLCQRYTYTGTMTELGMGSIYINPKNPVTFGYCFGSCAGVYSVDARNRGFVTDDVLFRRLVNLTNVAIPANHKVKIKSPCCVPVEYTSLRESVLTSSGTVKTTNKYTMIVSKCGCR